MFHQLADGGLEKVMRQNAPLNGMQDLFRIARLLQRAHQGNGAVLLFGRERVHSKEKESQVLLEAHAKVLVAAVLRRCEKAARQGEVDDLFQFLLLLSPAVLRRVLNEELLPAANEQLAVSRNGREVLA